MAVIGHRTMGLVDTWMVGQIGVTELAALGLGTTLLFGLTSVGCGAMYGLDAVFCGTHGSGDYERLNRLLVQSFWIGLSFSGFLILLGYASWDP